MKPLVSIEVHDVAPATWSSCRALLGMLDSLGASNVTLLVVPWYHRGVSIDDAPAFVDAISRRLVRGDEAALHGFVHLDEAAPPRTLRDRFERRLLTRREGEFAATGFADARERIERAIAIWRSTGWPLAGFVPPAWLLGPYARAAIDDIASFEYVALRHRLIRLTDAQAVASDTMWYSPTSAPRRAMSRAAIALTALHAARRRLLRIALHPRDADVPSVLAHWQRIVSRALDERTLVTTRTALAAHGNLAALAVSSTA